MSNKVPPEMASDMDYLALSTKGTCTLEAPQHRTSTAGAAFRLAVALQNIRGLFDVGG